MKSFSAWSGEDRIIRYKEPAPFDGVIMSNADYAKVYQDLEACDIWKKYLKERPKEELFCQEPEPLSFKVTIFLAGILTGALAHEIIDR